jgi:hypothetical protein
MIGRYQFGSARGSSKAEGDLSSSHHDVMAFGLSGLREEPRLASFFVLVRYNDHRMRCLSASPVPLCVLCVLCVVVLFLAVGGPR